MRMGKPERKRRRKRRRKSVGTQNPHREQTPPRSKEHPPRHPPKYDPTPSICHPSNLHPRFLLPTCKTYCSCSHHRSPTPNHLLLLLLSHPHYSTFVQRTRTDQPPLIIPMNSTPNDSLRLKIWQQNLNTSNIAQLSLLNNTDRGNWDILMLQEPYINSIGNTASFHHYHVVYPTLHHASKKRCRAVSLISTAISPNSWTQIDFPSCDVVIIQISTLNSKCTLVNIYIQRM